MHFPCDLKKKSIQINYLNVFREAWCFKVSKIEMHNFCIEVFIMNILILTCRMQFYRKTHKYQLTEKKLKLGSKTKVSTYIKVNSYIKVSNLHHV